MDKFEFEIYNQDKSTELDRLALESKAHENAIAFSAKVTGALQDKRQNHNRDQKEKVSLSQLKEVYRKSATQFDKSLRPNHNRGYWAMARVNMFMRLLNDGSLRSSEALNLSLGVSSEWMPSSLDFFQAEADVKKYELNYNFENIDDLYLEEYKPIDFEWK
jgi:hypothetical protein